MSYFFFDADAVVKLWLPELGHKEIEALVEDDDNIVLISDFAMLETIAALGAIHRNKEMSKQMYDDACEEFGAFIASHAMNRGNFQYLQIGEDNIGDAVLVAREHGLRAGDALEIALALSLADIDLTVVSGDKRVLKAAAAEGLHTFNASVCRCPVCNGLMKPSLVTHKCLHCGSMRTTFKGAGCEDCGYECLDCSNPKWCERLMKAQYPDLFLPG